MKVKWLLDTGTTAARLVVDSGDLLGDKHGELKEGKRIVLYSTSMVICWKPKENGGGLGNGGEETHRWRGTGLPLAGRR
jgi:hypothetical protein